MNRCYMFADLAFRAERTLWPDCEEADIQSSNVATFRVARPPSTILAGREVHEHIVLRHSHDAWRACGVHSTMMPRFARGRAGPCSVFAARFLCLAAKLAASGMRAIYEK